MRPTHAGPRMAPRLYRQSMPIRFLVALPPVDLLLCAKHLFVATILAALSLGGLRRRIEALLMPDSRGRAAGARPRRRARPAAQGRRAGPRTGVAAVGRIAALIKAAQPQISNQGRLSDRVDEKTTVMTVRKILHPAAKRRAKQRTRCGKFRTVRPRGVEGGGASGRQGGIATASRGPPH